MSNFPWCWHQTIRSRQPASSQSSLCDVQIVHLICDVEIGVNRQSVTHNVSPTKYNAHNVSHMSPNSAILGACWVSAEPCWHFLKPASTQPSLCECTNCTKCTLDIHPMNKLYTWCRDMRRAVSCASLLPVDAFQSTSQSFHMAYTLLNFALDAFKPWTKQRHVSQVQAMYKLFTWYALSAVHFCCLFKI